MNFNKALIKGTLIKRYKRFLADIELENGQIITAHTANTGSMKGCCTPGSTVWLSDSGNPKRKYPLSWEIIEVYPGVLVGINTGMPNKLVKEGIESGGIKELQDYSRLNTEVPYGSENSRIDLLLENGPSNKCYIEVKNVTMAKNNISFFPDAVSSRASKHLRELMNMVKQGHRAVIFYCVQRNDTQEVRPADEIDPEYGKLLRQSIDAGVQALAYQFIVGTSAIELNMRIPVVCP